jgi:hypothetical protein
MRFVLDIQPRFDYGRAKHTVEITEHGAVFHSDSMDLTLHSFGRRDPGDPEAAVPEIHGDGLRTSIIMHEGQTAGIATTRTAPATSQASVAVPGWIGGCLESSASTWAAHGRPPGCCAAAGRRD